MFELRRATNDDLPALRRLILESVRGLSVGHYTAQQIESGLEYVFGPDTQLIADGTYYVVDARDESDVRLAAAGGWSKRGTLFGGDQHKSAGDPLLDPLLDPRADPARIRAFFVHPDFARRGLARMLFDACLAAATAAGFSALELGSTLPGEALYRSLGFVALEHITVPLPDGVGLPIIRMRRG